MEIKNILRRLNLKKAHIIGISIALLIIILSFIFLNKTDVFYFIIGISVVIAGLPFLVSITLENKSDQDKDERFLEFARNLVENVKAGTPISQSILNIRKGFNNRHNSVS